MNWSGRFWLLFSVYLLSLAMWQYTAMGTVDRINLTEVSATDAAGTISQNTGHLPNINFISNQRPALPLTVKIHLDFWWEVCGFDHAGEFSGIYQSTIIFDAAPLIISLAIKKIIFPFHTFH